LLRALLIRVRHLDSRTADGQITAWSSAKANIHIDASLNTNVWWEGNAGAGKSSNINVKTRLKRKGDRTKPSSRPE
jgi:hypothetical protein